MLLIAPPKNKYQVLNQELEDYIINADKDEQSNWLFLYPHTDFPGQWKVDSLHPSFQLNLQEVIGHYRAVSPAKLDKFLEIAKDFGYNVVFIEDPVGILDQYDHLKDIPPFGILSHLEGTINGFLPYQIQCYNKLKNLNAGIVLHSTGTGKTAVATSLLMHNADMDLLWFVVQGGKKVDAARAIKRLANLDSLIIRGPKKQREKIYKSLADAKGQIIITNYEKFTADFEYMQTLFTDKRILVIWDEMPTKLKNRTSQLYKNIARCLYTSASERAATLLPDHIRPAELKQIMMTETPIEKAPEDFFSCVRLLDPTILGTVTEFRQEYVKSYNHFNPFQPQEWHNLEKIGLLTAHITHQADKEDPDIAKYFPKPVEEIIYVEWNPSHRHTYDIFQEEIKRRRKKAHTNKAELADQEIFSLIGVMQMICDAPSMVMKSATQRLEFEELWETFVETGDGKAPNKKGSEAALRLIEAINEPLTDDGHPKLERLREDLTGPFKHDKITLFTVYGDLLLPTLSTYLSDWGINHVVYRGTEKQKQKAVDDFKANPSVQVFLSSDSGAEGLDLPEANRSINLDLPWNWSTKRQRANRKHRVVSPHEIVYDITYLMEDSVEDRKVELIAKKFGYHEAIFKGIINEEALSSRMTKADLIWMLTGENPD